MSVFTCCLRTTGVVSTRNLLNFSSKSVFPRSIINYNSKRTYIRQWLSSLLGKGFEVRQVKISSTFKPKGTLIYKAPFIHTFRFMTVLTASCATIFSCITVYDWLNPIENFEQSLSVMLVGCFATWLVPTVIIPAIAKRFVTRIYLESNYFVHVESHSRYGNNTRLARIPLGFIRCPPGQFKYSNMIRNRLLGLKIDNTWGLYFLRKSGRFCDKTGIRMLFGKQTVFDLSDQFLLRPIMLPPEVIDNKLFPPTNTKYLYDKDNEIYKSNPLKPEDTVFTRLNFYKKFNDWKIKRNAIKRKKQRQKLLKERGELTDEEIKKQNEVILSENDIRKNARKFPEYYELTNKKNLLINDPTFEDKKEIYGKNFNDLKHFTKNEICMMKEYNQINFVPLTIDKETGEHKHEKIENFQQKFNKRFYNIPLNNKQRFKYYFDEKYASLTEPKRKVGYVLSDYAVQEIKKAQTLKYHEWVNTFNIHIHNKERHPIFGKLVGKVWKLSPGKSGNLNRLLINPTHKKRGKQYWKRFIGRTWRPRKLSKYRHTVRWWGRYIKRRKIHKQMKPGKSYH